MSASDDIVILAELVAYLAIIVWALFAPGAGRRWSDTQAPDE